MPEEDRDAAIDNMHQNLVKIAHVVPEIFPQTDKQTHTQTYSLQYFATALAGKVMTLFKHLVTFLLRVSYSNL